MFRVRDDQKTRQDKRQTITKIKITIRQSQDKRKDNDKGKNKKTTTIDRQIITKASTKATTTGRTEQNRQIDQRQISDLMQVVVTLLILQSGLGLGFRFSVGWRSWLG